MYVKRFLWGVDGVRLAAGRDVDDTFVGGVLDRVGSLIVVECVEVGGAGSGERVGGVGWGMVVSNSSERSKVEKVRLASSAGFGSAIGWLNWSVAYPTYSSGNEALREEFAFWLSTEWLAMRRHVID